MLERRTALEFLSSSHTLGSSRMRRSEAWRCVVAFMLMFIHPSPMRCHALMSLRS